MIVSKPLLVISNKAEFHMNFNWSIIVLCMVLSSTLIIASPDISSTNGAPTFISFCSFGFITILTFGKIGKEQSHVFMTPSNSNVFLIPRTKSIFS